MAFHFDFFLDDLSETNGREWNEKRSKMPWEFLNQENFTDFVVKVDDKEYRCHRLILASHSDYFLALLSSGMKEAAHGRVELQGIKSEWFDVVFSYIYTGSLLGSHSDESLSHVFQVANMLQMADLELECVFALLKGLSFENCLQKKKLLLQWPLAHDELSVRILHHIDQFIEELVKDRWKDLIHSAGFLNAVATDLVHILDIKAKEEELSDFSYSFIQSDLLEGILNWVNFDWRNRKSFVKDRLDKYYCLHQINGSLAKKALKSLCLIPHAAEQEQEQQQESEGKKTFFSSSKLQHLTSTCAAALCKWKAFLAN